ncbi:hypothetical protein [Paraburkholderia caffeinilytica]|uniref:hypothetical protein n=1 Tax=Paraburkholderia caffeinilytica TaxID=1761016 RepID=UPI0038B9F788
MSAKEFRNDDKRYLAWIDQHPRGFVLNRRSAGNSASYMVLHTSTCRTVSQLSGNGSEGGFTGRAYIKVCASDRQALADYVRANGRPDGSFSKECAFCKPSATI